MTTIANTAVLHAPRPAFRLFTPHLAAKLRRAVEMFAAPYMVMGARYM